MFDVDNVLFLPILDAYSALITLDLISTTTRSEKAMSDQLGRVLDVLHSTEFKCPQSDNGISIGRITDFA